MQLVGTLDSTPARTMVPYMNMNFFYPFDRADVLQAMRESSRRRSGYAGSRCGQFAPFEEALHVPEPLSIYEMSAVDALGRNDSGRAWS